MTNDELNRYIRHYIEQDHTKSAIMLTGGWGTGKSHYIQNVLIPYLAAEENGKHECVTISLYGLSDLSDVSKNLYIETRAKWLNNRSEKAVVGGIIAKTIIKGAASFFNINVDPSKEDWDTIYGSIDLSGRLIIIEDVERVQFGITKFLGYINSLVEQDGVKVLLVANEDEIIQYKPIEEPDPEKRKDAQIIDKLTDHSIRPYTDDTEAYLVSKEKTISDTLRFEGNVNFAIRDIIKGFENPELSRFSGEDEVNEIVSLMREHEVYNLRSFLFACQKACDIFQQLEQEQKNDTAFLETILMGIIGYSLKIKSGQKGKWDTGDAFSVELGSVRYPLFRFCYDYIVFHHFNCKGVPLAQAALKEYRLYDENKSNQDEDLLILDTWFLETEGAVKEAVTRVISRLENPEDISFYLYGKIALTLIRIEHVIGCDISLAKERLIKNLYNKSDKLRADYLFMPIIGEKDKAVVEEYRLLEASMTASLNAKEETIFRFSYCPEDISAFYSKVMSKEGQILTDESFAARLNADSIIEMLKKCSASQIHEFRGTFISVYRAGNIGQFLSSDRPAIETLLDKIRQLENYSGYDRIQKMQIRYFENNLEDILTRL